MERVARDAAQMFNFLKHRLWRGTGENVPSEESESPLDDMVVETSLESRVEEVIVGHSYTVPQLDLINEGSSVPNLTSPPADDWCDRPLRQAHYTDAQQSVLGDSLLAYVQSKVHTDILEKPDGWSKIVVTGSYTRASPARISLNEKVEDHMNFYRPTATHLDLTTLQLNCYPGDDNVFHNASLVATYLSCMGLEPGIVSYVLPGESDSSDLFFRSNLESAGHMDIAIIGYAHRLKGLLSSEWEGDDTGERDIFQWQRQRARHGHTVTFIGCKINLWGDASGQLVRSLRHFNKARCILYIGKAGALSPDLVPYRSIATGSSSFFKGELIQWDNILGASLCASTTIDEGTQITVASPLVETFEWLAEWAPRCRTVDCEVGHLAKAAKDCGVSFGYLNILSDNISPNPEKYQYDLSRESAEGREASLREVEKILELFISNWSG